MILKHKIFALLAIVLFAFTSCKKDEANVDPKPQIDPQVKLNQKAIEYLSSGYWYDSSTNTVYQYDANEDKKGGTIKIAVIKDSKLSSTSVGSFSVLDNNNFKFDTEWKLTASTESKITFNKVVDGKTTEDTAIFTKMDEAKVTDHIVQSYFPHFWNYDANTVVLWEVIMNEDKVSGKIKVHEIKSDGTLGPLANSTFILDGLKIKENTTKELVIIDLSKDRMVLDQSNNTDPQLEFTKYDK